MNKLRNVVSLFDGMSCGYMALIEEGIEFDNYYSSEIDKHAIKQSQDWFPDVIRLGDVVRLRQAITWKDFIFNRLIESEYISSETKNEFQYMRNINWSEVDLLLAGSPCQGFSFAGKQLAFDDYRSKLFFEFVNIWNHIKSKNPNAKYLLENVFMKKEHENVISKIMNIEPVKINSALLSAQNRKRNYWTNIYNKPQGLFGFEKCMIPQPKDKGILLKDILEPDDQVDEKYYLSGKVLERILNKHPKINPDKSYSVVKNNNTSSFGNDRSATLIKVDKKGKPKKNQDKADCFTAGGNSGGNHSDMDIICVAMRGRNPDNPSDRKAGSPTKQRLEPQKDGKTNCINSVGKDNLVLTKNYIQWDVSGKGHKSQQDRAFYEDGKHGALASFRSGDKNGVLLNNYKIRRLTPRECARLQTVPDRYKWTVSDTQAYKICGNGWAVDVISYIFSFIFK